MDERHLLACARYVELNPVRAGLVRRAEDWRWSSARNHLGLAADGLTAAAPLLDRVEDWRAFLAGGLAEEEAAAIRRGERSGHALGDAAFLDRLTAALGRRVAPRPRGRPPRAAR
jgi:putative transposase